MTGDVIEFENLSGIYFLFSMKAFNCVIINLTNSALFHAIHIILSYLISPSAAGVCWMNISKSGFCRASFGLNMTWQECCAFNTLETVSWTPHYSLNTPDLVFWKVMTGGAPQCHRCHTSCKTVFCGKDRKCVMRDGAPHCVCRPQCDSGLKKRGPLCGTDGKRYRNYCQLLRQNCKYEQQTEIAYFGNCKKSCRKVKCFSNRYCLEDQNGFPHCVVCQTHCQPHLPKYYICGEDGKTYANLCELRAAICKKGRSIRIAYNGKCMNTSTCESVQCPSGTTCLLDPDSGQPVCVDCVNICTSTINNPVCGSDNVTYNSYCELQKEACNSGKVIRTRKSGPCKRKEATKIRHGVRHERGKKLKKKKLSRKGNYRANNSKAVNTSTGLLKENVIPDYSNKLLRKETASGVTEKDLNSSL